MGPTILLAGAAAMAAAVLIDAPVSGQGPEPGSAFVAFRVDSDRVIATLKVMEPSAPQITDGMSAEPMARFGYRYFDPPAPWREQAAADIRSGDRWLIHSAPGHAFQAEAERIVGGNAGCKNAIGVLLRVVPGESDAFTALPAKYFLAERSVTLQPSKAATGSTVGVASSPATAEFRRALESTLNAVLARELPRVQAETASNLARMASSPVAYHRAWARQQQAANEAMQRGRGTMSYDIQSFRLAACRCISFARSGRCDDGKDSRRRCGSGGSHGLKSSRRTCAPRPGCETSNSRTTSVANSWGSSSTSLIGTRTAGVMCSWRREVTNRCASPCSSTRRPASSPPGSSTPTAARPTTEFDGTNRRMVTIVVLFQL